MTKEGYEIKDIYQGSYSPFDTLYLGYNARLSEIGSPTSIRTANQLKEINQRISEGVVPIELQPLSNDVFEQIPKQDLKEAQRLAELTGAKLSLHAPIIDPSGFGERGWSEIQKKEAEERLKSVLERALDLDKKGNVPVVIHASAAPGSEFIMTPEGKKAEKIVAINQETGELTQSTREIKYYPLGEKGVTKQEMTPESGIRSINNTKWENTLLETVKELEDVKTIVKRNYPVVKDILKGVAEGRYPPDVLNDTEKKAIIELQKVEGVYLEDLQLKLNSMFNQAYKYYDNPKAKKELEKLAEEYSKRVKEISKKMSKVPALAISDQINAVNDFIRNINVVSREYGAPQVFVPIEKFAVEKASDTFANAALHAFEIAKKKKKEAPVLAIENLYQGMAFSQSEDLKKLIETSQEKFAKKLVKKGYSKDFAEEQARKIIGATLDVGHLNISRKKGFSEEDLREEAKRIAKHVKHIHLTDNFGFTDSHLAPGMGNVPIKEILQELDKAGVKARKIVEAGGFVMNFERSPLSYTLEALGSSIYADGRGPFWNYNTGLFEGYYGGMGPILPNINYSTFGAGFSQLPMDLGGSNQGSGSRFSGRPME